MSSSGIVFPRRISFNSHDLFSIPIGLIHYFVHCSWCKKNSSKTSSGDSGIGIVGPTEDVKGRIVCVTKLVDHTGGNVCLEEIVDGKAKEVAVEEERVKKAAGWISDCIGMVLSGGRGVVDSNVGLGWSVVDSNVGWGVEVGVIDSVVGKRWLVRVMFGELAEGSVVEIGEAQERETHSRCLRG